MDPFSFRFTSGVSATVKLVELTYQIRATDEHTADILNTAIHVDRNLALAWAQLNEKSTWLSDSERKWVRCVMGDTKAALNAVAKLIEPARIDKAVNGNIGWGSKVFWAFKYSPQVKDKHSVLVVCHQTLMTAVARLLSLQPPVVTETSVPLQPPPPPYDPQMEKLWRYQAHRKERKAFAPYAKAAELPAQDMDAHLQELQSIPAFELESRPVPWHVDEKTSRSSSPSSVHRSVSASDLDSVSRLSGQSSRANEGTFELSTSRSVARRPQPSISSIASDSETSRHRQANSVDAPLSRHLSPRNQTTTSSIPVSPPDTMLETPPVSYTPSSSTVPRSLDVDQRSSWASDERRFSLASLERHRPGSPWDSAVTLASVAARSDEGAVGSLHPENSANDDNTDHTTPRLNQRRGIRGSWREYQRSLSVREQAPHRRDDMGGRRHEATAP